MSRTSTSAKAEDVTGVWQELQKINQSIQNLEKTLGRKIKDEIDQLKTSFNEKIDDTVKRLEDYVDQEITKVIRRVEALEAVASTVPVKPAYDPSCTIVAINVPFDHAEDVMDKAEQLVRTGLQSPGTRVVNAMRTPRRGEKPGVVKIELEDEDIKIQLLRKKPILKQDPSRQFNKVYIRSSKSHAERLEELNTRMLLNMIPNGNNFRIAGNGRIIKKDETQDRTGNDNSGRRSPPHPP